ncbi:MAG: GlcNAc transferase, partial [Planctomycetaceae bacterium]|nr:GlcNAc transferase [Planctomycetaceae bacterium]
MSELSDERNIPNLETGSPCLQGECVAFTGILASMTHRQAFELVEEHGGGPTTHVNRQTTMLVIGEEGWPLEA